MRAAIACGLGEMVPKVDVNGKPVQALPRADRKRPAPKPKLILSRRHFSRPTPERCPRDGARRSSREDCDERLGTRDSYCVRQVQYFERFRSENRGGKTCYVSRCKGRLQNDYRSASVAAGKFSTKLIFHILGA